MKKLNVMVAGLGWRMLERRGSTEIAGLRFHPERSVFPAVTCVAQATLRTGLQPEDHGMLANGFWSADLGKPLFWEQNAALVKGRRVWSGRRAAGEKIGMFFFQQSLGEDVDAVISPAPIHKHGGGMVMSCYAKPSDAAPRIEKRCGGFPLWKYWGPLASPTVGRNCIDWFEAMLDETRLDEAYLYLPTLDYAAQKYGPGSRQDDKSFKELCSQLERLAELCGKLGAELCVKGDYEITPVTREPVNPNVSLREAGLFRVRTVKGMAYPDFYQSSAFAMCDHEFCIIFGEEKNRAADALLSTGEYELPQDSVHGATILLAKQGGWCDYRWWTRRGEAPDFAAHIDIHNKPGFDPRELFFFCRGTVRGTHGRRCEIACAD